MILCGKLGAAQTLFLVLLTLGSASAAAEEVEPGEGQAAVDTSDIVASLKRCGGSQLSMNFCADDHARAIMPMLEASASRVRSLLASERHKAAFDKVQKAFVDYVEAACNLDAEQFYGGSMAMWSKQSCIVRRVAPHIKALDDYADCKIGSIGCETGTTLTDVDLGEIQ